MSIRIQRQESCPNPINKLIDEANNYFKNKLIELQNEQNIVNDSIFEKLQNNSSWRQKLDQAENETISEAKNLIDNFIPQLRGIMINMIQQVTLNCDMNGGTSQIQMLSLQKQLDLQKSNVFQNKNTVSRTLPWNDKKGQNQAPDTRTSMVDKRNNRLNQEVQTSQTNKGPKIHNADAKNVFDQYQEFKTLKEFLDFPIKQNVASLKFMKIDLENQGINDLGLSELCKQLEHFRYLEKLTLNLNNNSLTEKSGQYVKKALTEIKSLQTINISFYKNKLRYEGTNLIAQAISHHENIHTLQLDLSVNNIGERGALTLAQNLKSNKKLTALYLALYDNNINNEACRGIMEAILCMPKLNSLELDFRLNNISTQVSNFIRNEMRKRQLQIVKIQE